MIKPALLPAPYTMGDWGQCVIAYRNPDPSPLHPRQIDEVEPTKQKRPRKISFVKHPG
jgi:hypothetical protein